MKARNRVQEQEMAKSQELVRELPIHREQVQEMELPILLGQVNPIQAVERALVLEQG